MYITIPNDVIESTIDSMNNTSDPVVGVLLGQHIPSETVTQIWGVSNIVSLNNLNNRVVDLEEMIKSGESSKLDIESSEDYISNFIPSKLDVVPTGLIVVDTTGDESFDTVNIPTIRLFNKNNQPNQNSDSKPAFRAKGKVWEASLVGANKEDNLEIVHAQRDAQMRIDGLIDTDILADTHVTVVGLGTVGSTVCVELAKAGVGSFTLIDFDRLEIHNITRHICGISDLGRKKTHAVRDEIHRTNSRANVEIVDADISDVIEDAIINKTDAVAVCTDTDTSKLILNRHCLKNEVPAVYAGVYERAMGGDVIRIRPGETPCYDCILGNMTEDMNRNDRVSGDPDYTLPSDDQPSAEPGLSVDVGFISLIQTRYILATLLADPDSKNSGFDRDMCFWGNKNEYIFTRPLQSRFATVSYRDDCETCGGTGEFEETTTNVDINEMMETVSELDEDPRPN